jgi:hypothetical protein
MCVDRPQRTEIDSKLNHRLSRVVEILTDTGTNSWSATFNEVQLMMRWYLMVPQGMRDHSDNRIYKNLETFVNKRG